MTYAKGQPDMTDNPLTEVAAFAIFWVVVIYGLVRKRGLSGHPLGEVVADAENWSPVGRIFGCAFLLLMAAVTMASLIRLLRQWI